MGVKNDFAIKFRLIRAELGLSQDLFAKELDITQNAVSSYERGKFKPRYEILKKILDVADKHGLSYSIRDFID